MTKQHKEREIDLTRGKLKDFIYTPTYELRKVDFNRIIFVDSEVEYSGVYKADEHLLQNPPDHSKLIEKLKKLLKGTGINKITITFLQENLK